MPAKKAATPTGTAPSPNDANKAAAGGSNRERKASTEGHFIPRRVSTAAGAGLKSGTAAGAATGMVHSASGVGFHHSRTSSSSQLQQQQNINNTTSTAAAQNTNQRGLNQSPVIAPSSRSNSALGNRSLSGRRRSAKSPTNADGVMANTNNMTTSTTPKRNIISLNATAIGDENNNTNNSNNGNTLESFQAFSHRRTERTAGQRMARLRRQRGVGVSALVNACRMGVGSQYEAVESGTSALERYAALLARFAINLEVPVDTLLPHVAVGGGVIVNNYNVKDATAAAGTSQHYGAGNTEDITSLGSSATLLSSGGGGGDAAVLSPPAAATTAVAIGACGHKLRQARAEKGMSIESVCANTSVSSTEYRQIEAGESASGYEKWVWVITRYCALLNVNPFVLVGGLALDGDDSGGDSSDAEDNNSSDGSRSELAASSLMLDL